MFLFDKLIPAIGENQQLPPIINAQGLSKQYGTVPLFLDLSFTISEGARIGLIGPNGSGKSTLLEILHGGIKPDSGSVAIRKGARLEMVAQVSDCPPDQTVRSVIETSARFIGSNVYPCVT